MIKRSKSMPFTGNDTECGAWDAWHGGLSSLVLSQGYL